MLWIQGTQIRRARPSREQKGRAGFQEQPVTCLCCTVKATLLVLREGSEDEPWSSIQV